MLYLLLPLWQSELALNFAQVGILKTLYSAAMALGQVPAAHVGERWSEKALLVAGTFVAAAAVFALQWATSPVVLGLLLAIGGLRLLVATNAGSIPRVLSPAETQKFAGEQFGVYERLGRQLQIELQ